MTVDVARARLRRWQADARVFARECLGVTPDAWQDDALGAASQHNRIALKAAKGPGKTAVLAWLILWFLVTRPHAKIAATAITGDNLRDNLWAELAKWRGASSFLLATTTWTKTRLFVTEAPEQWFVTARQWPKTADPQAQADTLAGLHADRVMFVLDESGGIPQAVMATAEAVLASGKESKVIQAGNPTTLDGPLYRACVTDRHLWQVIQITGDPDDPKRSPRISREWAQQQIDTYGRDNPWVRVNVLGEFPPASLNALLGPEDVDEAQRRHLPEGAYTWAQKRLGIDVARYGDDRNVLYPRQGRASFRPTVWRAKRDATVSHEIATKALRAKAAWGSELEFIDATGGWGAGARDIMVTAGVTPIEVQFGGRAMDPRYANRRSEIWFGMARWVLAGGVLAPVPELVGELTTPTYTFNSQGKFLLEPKELVKERLGRSPDLADALATTFAIPDQPRDQLTATGRRSKHVADWDPYAERE